MTMGERPAGRTTDRGPASGEPAHATDCHVHVFDPQRFAYHAARRYTPASATVEALIAVHARLGIERCVLVQPSVYGTDHRCLLAALDVLGGRARGVAVIDDGAGRAELEALHARGVRGARLNLQVSHDADVAQARQRLLRLSQQLQALPWVIQLHAALPVTVALASTLRSLPHNVLLDHFASASAAGGLRQAGFGELLALLASPNVHIKLSGPYQISHRTPAYDDVAPIARSLLAAAPCRAVWGSDWPHPAGAQRPANTSPEQVEAFREEDDARNLGLLSHWCDAAERRQVLVDTPARLFGFAAPDRGYAPFAAP
jgi:predicted TIM-barrel fold metal-dependent hydrolase